MRINKWFILLVAVLAIILALSATKDNIIKYIVERGVQGVTGLHLKIEELRVGLLETKIDIRGLRLYNPGGFKDKVMLDMPEIYVHYDLPAVFRGVIHFKDMKISMKEFTVEKNARGDLNLNSLKMVSEGDDAKAQPAEAKKAPGMKLQIDTLELKVGKVMYKDYSQGGAPKVQEFDVDIDQTFSDITDLKSLISLIIYQSLTKTAISKLADFEMDKLQKSISDRVLSSIMPGGKLLGSSAMGKALGGAVEKMEESFMKGSGGGGSE